MENKNVDKYQDHAWELTQLWNMKVSVIPIIFGALGTNTKNLKKELEIKGKTEAI